MPFRCDSPSLQRHMRMTITHEHAGQLLYACLLVRAVPQRHTAVLDSGYPRADAHLTMCSCCKRALLEPLGWLDVEEVSVRLGLFEAEKVPELRHTICPECAGTLKSAADNGNAA